MGICLLILWVVVIWKQGNLVQDETLLVKMKPLELEKEETLMEIEDLQSSLLLDREKQSRMDLNKENERKRVEKESDSCAEKNSLEEEKISIELQDSQETKFWNREKESKVDRGNEKEVETTQEESYSIVQKEYIENEKEEGREEYNFIEIEYPQLCGYSDREKEDRINTIIEKDVKKNLRIMRHMKERIFGCIWRKDLFFIIRK